MLSNPRRWAAALLVVSAVLFAVGAFTEQHHANAEARPAVQHSEQAAAGSADRPEASTAEGGGQDNGEATKTAPEAGAENAPEAGTENAPEKGHVETAGEHGSETLLGINPESTALVLIAVGLSLLLAVAMLARESMPMAAVAAAAMVVFTALDVREVTHQLNESNTGLATLAAVVAALHLAAGAAAIQAIRNRPRILND